MNLEQLERLLLTKITDAAQQADLDRIKRLSSLSSELKEIKELQINLISRVDHLASSVQDEALQLAPVYTPTSIDYPLEKGIIITIHWEKLGIKKHSEVINERLDSKTLAYFYQRLREELGLEVLEKASRFRVSRGLIISTNPNTDYAYQDKAGHSKVYANHKINGTAYHVLTNTTSDQKINDLKNLIRFLSLPFGSIEIKNNK
ncbi:MAG: hypothetical protein LBH01_12235 [Verrucomicrobiales bacterium]|jgi:hypothetical protein|nr:hypothetical protein [Verrucomicrobiales bacterium]